MILRRFMKHVTDQNWFAVGLDVIVVVVGIFLGMQVTEWNQDREINNEVTIYKHRLINELKENITRLDNDIQYYQGVIDYYKQQNIDVPPWEEFTGAYSDVSEYSGVFTTINSNWSSCSNSSKEDTLEIYG